MATAHTKVSIGIDLGTSYSCVAAFKNGRAEVIANSQGNRITPSVVAFTEAERLVGEGAVTQKVIDPVNVIYNAKRFIGRRWDDPTLKENTGKYPFELVQSDNKVQFKVSHKQTERCLAPEEISAAVLAKMKKTAEDYLDEKVTDAVITVPAYFDDAQRQATKNAAQIAGLNVLRIINEPTAAALAYGHSMKTSKRQNDDDDEANILVYDLGGGTFDVSVLEAGDDLLDVKATNGNTDLGGEDFNTELVRHFKKEIFRKHNVDLTGQTKAIGRLTRACEALKRNLSADNVTQSTMELDSLLPDGTDVLLSLTRAKFESLCQPLFDQTMKCVEQVLKDARLGKDKINEVILVGGSTRIPKIQSMLQKYFNGKTLNKSVNPDEAVACGAAVQAAILNYDPHLSVQDMLLRDVNPLSLGLGTYSGVTTKVIPRNTSIPVRKEAEMQTAVDNATSINFSIYEGQSLIFISQKLFS